MRISRRGLLVAGAGLVAMPGIVRAQSVEKPKLVLGVGGKNLLYYLPLTIAERRGFFKEQGLDVEITDFGGGAKALQSLVGGSADIVTGAYEHTIRMQAKGIDIRSTLELGRFPAIVVAVKKDLAGKVKSAADLKGLKIGVTAPGSSTNMLVQFAMVKAGLKPMDAAWVGVGAGASAVAAMKKGEIDAISNLDPVISKLEADGDIVVLIDTRTEAGTQALFGGTNPAACLYMKNDFIEKNPETTQRLVNGLFKALKWIGSASADDIANSVPAEYHLGDKGIYMRSLAAVRDSYSKNGIVSEAGHQSIHAMLVQLDAELKDAKIGRDKTFVERFVAKASA
ncbi:MAG TPA: ABC transporter substrate-binding protein [Beijerinckiaceae bacterium]|nr:ABC transporter substrate-binding protein [Beijerinckiaceae bacterium]